MRAKSTNATSSVSADPNGPVAAYPRGRLRVPTVTWAWGGFFTVRSWDYSRMPPSRIAPKPLKTLDRKFSTREKIRSSHFTFLLLLSWDVTLLRPAESCFDRADAPSLFSTHVLSKKSRKFSIINKSAKIGRHTFLLFDMQALIGSQLQVLVTRHSLALSPPGAGEGPLATAFHAKLARQERRIQFLPMAYAN